MASLKRAFQSSNSNRRVFSHGTRSIHALAFAAAATLAGTAQAELIYGLTVPSGGSANLVSFDSATPSLTITIGTITGITAGHTLRGIDFRPATGQLYAISSLDAAAQLYTLNLGTGAATPVGSGFVMSGNTSTRVSMDFNPVVDALRVVTGSGQNYRVNGNTGALIAQDTNISGLPLIAGVAYSNNFAGASQTTLYGYDFILDELGTIGGLNGTPSPNGGVFTVIGGSGVTTFNAAMGFDISGVTGTAYISVDDFDSPGVNAEFYTVNLATGSFTQVGAADLFPLLDISAMAAPVPEPAAWLLTLAGLCGVGLRCRRR